MTDFLTLSVLLATVASGIRLATPFLLAALGETIGQRSGVLNLGVEGVMLLGAYGAYYATLRTDSILFGILVSLIVGGVMGVVYGVVTLALKAEQGISGIGIFIFGLGSQRSPVPEAGRDSHTYRRAGRRGCSPPGRPSVGG